MLGKDEDWEKKWGEKRMRMMMMRKNKAREWYEIGRGISGKNKKRKKGCDNKG